MQPRLVSSAACDESRGCLGIFREKSKASVILQSCLSDGIWHGEIPVGWFDRRLHYSKRTKTTNYSTIQFATIARLYCDNHNHRLSSHTEIQYQLLQNHAETIFNNLIVPTPACTRKGLFFYKKIKANPTCLDLWTVPVIEHNWPFT